MADRDQADHKANRDEDVHEAVVDNKDEHTQLVFEQTSEFLRAADEKQLAIIGAFLGITAGVAAILADKGAQFLTPSPSTAAVYWLLAITAYAVVFTLRWYSAWKLHYIDTIQAIVRDWRVPPEKLPFWMRTPKAGEQSTRSRWRVDDLFQYLTGLLSIALVALATRSLLAVLRGRGAEMPTGGWVITGVAVLAYVVLLYWTYQVLFRNAKHLNA